MSGITLKETAAASIPTPAATKVTVFLDSADSTPKYKDDAGAVTSLVGTPGAAGQGVPTGGTTGQALVKVSGTDYDTTWSDVASQAFALAAAATISQNSQSAAYTLVLADAGKHIYHPSTDANARTFTIPANASVAFPIGTAVTFINETSQVVTIAITSDTLVLAGTGSTGSRSLAQYGVATAIKVTSTRWVISGPGLT